VRTGTTATAAQQAGDRRVHLTLDTGDALDIDRVILASGRRPAADGAGLERLGIALGDDGSVP